MAAAIAWADLQARLESAQIALNGVLVKIAYPNSDFSLPSQSEAWMRVEMSYGASSPYELGTHAMWLEEGQTIVDVMVMSGTGLDDTISIIDQLKATFRGPPYDPVVYHRVTADPGGSGSDDGLYWVTSIRADWHVQSVIGDA